MQSCDPKRKMISIRLSEAEYEVLRTHYRTYGAHNVSELARLALQRILTGPAATQGDVAVKLSELDERVRSLESHVTLLTQPKPSRTDSASDGLRVLEYVGESEAL